ncbi:hypothetical protein BZARG_1919 [Bizionia argentinensis JUB59]|uniref:Outer membrane protein beta-barrel domain-containing protein n=1 Tax=Bizionia argentinensis JUB59 TaxID=1046627 RepID=G2EG85_9FLAO|nr:hypothetical protein [Bizionia argentinensis]EGV42595.2 hypothetical protein BZARG_1919 [Bizionia argentinensis JUB59]
MIVNLNKALAILFVCILNWSAFAQKEPSSLYTSHNKGKTFLSWGGNRGAFTKSDINFKGDNYNFTTEDVKASDKPKGWHIDYLNPTRMTIPQTNFKVGHFISDNYYLALGLDHMKYVMNQNQYANINGYIDLPASEAGSIHNGIYQNESIQLTEEFLMFEHTDGLNYLYAEFGRFDDISSIFGIINTDIFQVNITEGVGAGVLYPKTNTTLLQKNRYDDFHISGYGVALNAGINLTFLKYFFIQGDLRGGYINMPNVRTTRSSNDSASHHFMFIESVFSIGGIFRI